MIAYRPRYIILDEATSRIDRYLEEEVRGIIEDEFRAATCLVIAHRISTMVEMDRIIVIHNGELAEEGSHAELLEKKGRLSPSLQYLQERRLCLGAGAGKRRLRCEEMAHWVDEFRAVR